MHSAIRDYQQHSTEDRQTQDIGPEGENVEAEGAEDGGAGDFDVETVFLLDEGEEPNFVDH